MPLIQCSCRAFACELDESEHSHIDVLRLSRFGSAPTMNWAAFPDAIDPMLPERGYRGISAGSLPLEFRQDAQQDSGSRQGGGLPLQGGHAMDVDMLPSLLPPFTGAHCLIFAAALQVLVTRSRLLFLVVCRECWA